MVLPQCRRIAASAFRTHPLPDADAWEATIRVLWRQAAFREERHAAIEFLEQAGVRGDESPAPRRRRCVLCIMLHTESAWNATVAN